jgi:signal transduction histidine kinase
VSISSAGREVDVGPLAEPAPLPSARDTERFRALADLSRALADSITDTAGVLNSVVELVSQFLGDTAVLRILEDDGEHMSVVAAYDRDPVARDAIRDALTSTPGRIGLTPYGQAVRESRTVGLDGEALDAALAAMSPDARRALNDLGVRAALICPLRVHGKVIGALGLWRRGDRPPYTDRDQSFAQDLADRAALAIENARLVERLRAEVEERARNEDHLRVAAELLQYADEKRKALVEHLVAAQEEERRRIAVDVHDDSIQAMAAIGLRLQILRRHAPDREFASRVSEIEDTVTESIGRLRSLLFRLETASLEKEGLAHAVGRCIAELFPEGTPRGRVVSRLQREPPGYVQIVLFRVAQEALTNVRKHARASEVVVVLSHEDDGTLLVVQDDGLGFDPEELAKHALPGHLGLRGMEQRSQVASGWLRVESKPGKGTSISCWLPPIESVDTGDGAAFPQRRPVA